MNMEAMATALRDSAIKPTGLETTDLRLRAMGLNKAPLMSVALILSTFLFFCGRISYRKKKKPFSAREYDDLDWSDLSKKYLNEFIGLVTFE